MRILSAATAIFAVLTTVSAARDSLPDCSGLPNTSPVIEPNVIPLKTVLNGQSYLLSNDSANYVYLAKVSGSPYEMGYAQGELFKDELPLQLLNYETLYPVMTQSVLHTNAILPDEYILMIPEWILIPLGKFLLDMNWYIALPWIPQRYADELEGMADASGLSFERLRRANMVPEIIQAHCTVFGAWGPATEDGKVYHLRALDWNPFTPINQFPAIIIYESNEEGSQTIANINYLGWIGTLTTMSKLGISVGEKVMLPREGSHDYPEWPQVTYFGKPWQFVLRDTTQFATNLADVYYMLNTAKRTMRIHGGWGSAPDHSFRGMDFAANFVKLYDDHNYTHYSNQSHPQMDGIFYLDKHVQPSDNQCIKNIITPQYGHITAETIYSNLIGDHRTGDNMWVVMKPESGDIWMASSQYGAPVEAYRRSPIHVRLGDFW
ncbi:hypothetical protein FGO68_gene8749 [Halteria grandinella]|uniref:Uncharacterized protein n=1 Tax=Halteria grandinella TaxID=5974 RepID=A0A8J8T1J7_HALGN|nr:hypothetical protein FGO68_gene8749 [Halteria grandinella]